MCEFWTIRVALLLAMVADVEATSIVPRQETQAALSRLAASGTGKLEFYEAVIDLRSIKRELGATHVLEQAILFDATVDRNRSNPRALRNVKWQLFDGDELSARLVAMRFWFAQDAHIRDLARRIVLQADAHRIDRNSFIARRIWDLRANPPPELVYALFESDPGAMLRTVAGHSDVGEPPVDSETMKADLLGERVIAEAHWRLERSYESPEVVAAALRELDRLSLSPRWWARLYVSEMLRRHETFRRRDLVERLRGDPNKFVSETVDRPYHRGMDPEEFLRWKRQTPGLPDRPK
jgi:hypothetical protein